jgi:hypothetical protein
MSIDDVTQNLQSISSPVAAQAAQNVRANGKLRVSPYHGQVFTDDLAPVERLIDEIIFSYVTGG